MGTNAMAPVKRQGLHRCECVVDGGVPSGQCHRRVFAHLLVGVIKWDCSPHALIYSVFLYVDLGNIAYRFGRLCYYRKAYQEAEGFLSTCITQLLAWKAHAPLDKHVTVSSNASAEGLMTQCKFKRLFMMMF